MRIKNTKRTLQSLTQRLQRPFYSAFLVENIEPLTSCIPLCFYDELISYADLYDSANFEAKKMIVNQLIRRVDVYRGYQINILFNFDLTPYIEGE